MVYEIDWQCVQSPTLPKYLIKEPLLLGFFAHEGD